jgi:hypothetical protein
MYTLSVALLLFVMPALSVAVEAWLGAGASVWLLIGKWFVFWAGGVRLFLAGVRQTMRPAFTAETIFGIHDPSASGLVREIGFGNLSMGTLGLVSLLKPDWLVPAAIVSGLYYGLAGLGHAGRGGGNAHEQIALWTDLYAFVLLAAVAVTRL